MIEIINFGNISGIESRILDIEKRMIEIAPTKEFTNVLSSVINEGKDGIDKVIEEISAKHGVDKNLVNIIAKAESNKNPNVVSEKGAIGIMQLMPGTAKELGVKNPFDVKQNIEGGVTYFKELLDKYKGNTEKALAAYNSGPGTVDKYGGIPPYKETQNYVRKIMKEYNEMSSLKTDK